MAYNNQSFQIIGVSPLVMHNGQLANPLNRFARDIKQISRKRNKTDADFEELARLEWLGSLYLFKGEPCLTGELIEGCIVRGAATKKRSKQAKAGVLCLGAFPLRYEGPRDPLELWKHEQFRLQAGVRVGGARVIRTRPVFSERSAEVAVRFNPSLLNEMEVLEFLKAAGELEGMGDWRTRFGRFEVAQA